MSVFSRALDEIGLDGHQGCTIKRLKQLLQVEDDELDYISTGLRIHPQITFREKDNTFLASDTLIDFALGLPNDGTVNLTVAQKSLLECIARTRSEGLAQSNIPKVLKIDSPQYHAKTLQGYDLINATRIYRPYTLLFTLKRYGTVEIEAALPAISLAKKKVNEILSAKPSKSMTESTIIDTLRPFFGEKTITVAIRSGLKQKALVQTSKGVKLAHEIEYESVDDIDEKDSVSYCNLMSHLPLEVSLADYIRFLVCQAGEQGILQIDIRNQLSVSVKLLEVTLLYLKKIEDINVTAELSSKQTINRITATKSLMEKMKFKYTFDSKGTSMTKKVSDQESNKFFSVIPPLPLLAFCGAIKQNDSSEQKEENECSFPDSFDNHVEENCEKATAKKRKREKDEPKKRGKRVIKDRIEREEIILREIESKEVLSLNEIRRILNDQFKHKMDKRTVQNTLWEMVEKKSINMFKVLVPSLESKNVLIDFVTKPTLSETSPQVKKKIEQCKDDISFSLRTPFIKRQSDDQNSQTLILESNSSSQPQSQSQSQSQSQPKTQLRNMTFTETQSDQSTHLQTLRDKSAFSSTPNRPQQLIFGTAIELFHKFLIHSQDNWEEKVKVATDGAVTCMLTESFSKMPLKYFYTIFRLSHLTFTQEHQELLDTPFSQLPQAIRNQIMYKKRYLVRMRQLCSKLSEFSLLRIDRSVFMLSVRSEIFDGFRKQSIAYSFDREENLQIFWEDLQFYIARAILIDHKTLNPFPSIPSSSFGSIVKWVSRASTFSKILIIKTAITNALKESMQTFNISEYSNSNLSSRDVLLLSVFHSERVRFLSHSLNVSCGQLFAWAVSIHGKLKSKQKKALKKAKKIPQVDVSEIEIVWEKDDDVALLRSVSAFFREKRLTYPQRSSDALSELWDSLAANSTNQRRKGDFALRFRHLMKNEDIRKMLLNSINHNSSAYFQRFEEMKVSEEFQQLKNLCLEIIFYIAIPSISREKALTYFSRYEPNVVEKAIELLVDYKVVRRVKVDANVLKLTDPFQRQMQPGHLHSHLCLSAHQFYRFLFPSSPNTTLTNSTLPAHPFGYHNLVVMFLLANNLADIDIVKEQEENSLVLSPHAFQPLKNPTEFEGKLFPFLSEEQQSVCGIIRRQITELVLKYPGIAMSQLQDRIKLLSASDGVRGAVQSLVNDGILSAVPLNVRSDQDTAMVENEPPSLFSVPKEIDFSSFSPLNQSESIATDVAVFPRYVL